MARVEPQAIQNPIVIDDREKAEKLKRYLIDIEGRPVDIAKNGIVPNLSAFISAVNEQIDALKAGGEFADLRDFDEETRRVKGLAQLATFTTTYLGRFQAIDQAQIDAGEPQIFDSIEVDNE